MATYNIQNLTAAALQTGDRAQKLRTIVQEIGADVFSLQEVADRQALEMIFPLSAWSVIIDDDSRDGQDLAVAVRKPWKPVGFDADLDADDRHFLASERAVESYFPNRRDGLVVPVIKDGLKSPVYIASVHLKSRRDGRKSTDERREGAARILAQRCKGRFQGKLAAIMGDFNDNPDDRSLNILETGVADTAAGPEETDGALFANLCEPLVARDMVTEGCSPRDGGLIEIVVPGSRQRNNQLRGTDRYSGAILFDQILATPLLKKVWIKDSTQIYHKGIALQGPGFSRPSDHLPVYADFQLTP